MKKIFLGIVFLVVTFIILQSVRYNYVTRQAGDFEYFDLNNNKVKLEAVFNKNNNKLIVYIIPDCESCMVKIKEILQRNKQFKSQLIIVSVGLVNFNFKQFYIDNFEDNKSIFLIDKNNTFYRDFGLGFAENFPTVIKYNLNENVYKRIQ